LTTLYFAGAENIDSWCARNGDLQHTFPLDLLIVHSTALTISTDGEHLMCGGFTLGKIVCFASLGFIIDCFSGMSLSPKRNDLGTSFMGSTHSGPPSPLWAMIEDSTEEFYKAWRGEEGSDLPYCRRHGTGALPAPVATTPWLEDAPPTQDKMTVPPWALASRLDTGFPFE
jgi:hypothetical protein